MYRIGLPFWELLGRLGVPLKLRIDVIHDKEADVFVATSNDLKGLVAEAKTIEELFNEVQSSINDLLTEILHSAPTHPPAADLRLCMT